MNPKSKRNAVVAALSNMFIPGLGYLYAGRLRYAIVFPILLFLLLGVFAWSRVIVTPLGFAVTYIFILLFLLLGIASAAIIARRSKAEELKKYQRWYVYLGFIIASIFVSNLFETHRAELFGYAVHRISSLSMSPTIMLGDFIVSDTWSYKDQGPVRGDLVIFTGTANTSTTYIMRVIGVPGDLIETNKGQLMINNEVFHEGYVDEQNNRRSKRREIYIKVPKGGYYLLGDNRDSSRDSRDFGVISHDKIIGKTSHVWLSFHPKEGLKTNRIGRKLNEI